MRKPRKNFAGYSGPGARSVRILKPGSKKIPNGYTVVPVGYRLREKLSRAINKAIRDLNKIEADLETLAETENIRAITIYRAIENIEGAIEMLCTEGIE